MTHVDEGLLVALRDGAADPSQEAVGRAHLAACPSCRECLADAEARSTDIHDALEALDVHFDTASARASVRARVARAAADAAGAVALPSTGDPGAPRGRAAPRGPRLAWVRAAGVVLFLGMASAAAGLPSSPVHRWVEGLLRPEAPAAAVESTTPKAAAGEATGVRIALAKGPLQVVLHGVSPESRVEVRWVPGPEAAVFGPVGSRFTSATGRLEARVVPGDVRVELPRGARDATLVVNGHTYLTVSADGVRVSGPVVRRDEEGILFRGDVR